MDRYRIGAILGRRGQRELVHPAPDLVIDGSEWMGPLFLQTFPRQGFSPRPALVVQPNKFQVGALMGDQTRATLLELDTIRPPTLGKKQYD